MLFALPALCDASAQEGAALDDFRQIPGATAEEIAAVEALKGRYSRFSLAIMPQNTECFLDEDGEMQGYSAMLCEWLTDLFEIPFVPEFYDWPDTIAGLADHSIDFTSEMTATPERREYMYMTDSIGERTIKVIRHIDSRKIAESTPSNPVRCCFLRGTTAYDCVEPYVSDIEVIYANSLSDVLTFFEEGTIDAFVVDGPAEAVFDMDDSIIAEDFSPMIYSPVSLSTQNPDLIPIIDLVQKILNSDYRHRISDMYRQGYTQYQRRKLSLQFTPEEKAYISQQVSENVRIPFIIEFDNYPVSFYNSREAQWQGASYDIMMEIGKLTGLHFVPANEPGTAWADILPMLRDGEALMANELIYSSDRVGSYIWAEEPYLTDYYALLSRSEYADVGVSEIVHSRVGVIRGSAYAEFFYECFPDHKNVIEYPNMFEAVNALERGEADLMMATRNILLSITNYLEKPGFKVNLVFMRASDSSFGFHVDQTLLCSVVSKAQRLVDTHSIIDRWQRKVFDYRSAVARDRIPLWIGLGVLIVFIITLLVILVIRNKRAGVLLEATVHERTKELEIASQAKSDFLSRMSHEIRTPLNAIIGMTAIAKSASTFEKAKSSIIEVETASQHLLGILNDVLDMSKIESGKFILVHEEFPLRTAMSEVSAIITQRCLDRRIEFVDNIPDIPDICVSGDKLRLKQVLINLLGNAVKFTPECGKILFLIENLHQDQAVITVRFSVEDSGIGITPEQKERLFSAFEQADSSIAVQFGGTGLGLAISQNLVGMMGGTIVVDSEFGKGSIFSFCLPMTYTNAAPSSGMPAHVEIPDLRGKRMLLTEDIEINRVILKELLTPTHLEIVEAENGLCAVELLRTSAPGHFDIIFMDILMPHMNGYEAARAIRALPHPDAQSIQIVAMTAHAYAEDIQNAIDAGMNAHLSKPVDINNVMRVLAERLC